MFKVAVVTISDRVAGGALAAGQNKDMSHRKIIASPACRALACCTLDIAGLEQERFVRMLKAAGNPTRFEIMKYLVIHPGCITSDIMVQV